MRSFDNFLNNFFIILRPIGRPKEGGLNSYSFILAASLYPKCWGSALRTEIPQICSKSDSNKQNTLRGQSPLGTALAMLYYINVSFGNAKA